MLPGVKIPYLGGTQIIFISIIYRFDETAILKRRERRIWEEKRTKILFEYQQFSDYGSSTALLMYELAWKMSRDTNDLVSILVVIRGTNNFCV